MYEWNFISIGDHKFFSFIHYNIKKLKLYYPKSKYFILLENEEMQICTFPCEKYNLYKIEKHYQKDAKILHYKGRNTYDKIVGLIVTLKIREFLKRSLKILGIKNQIKSFFGVYSVQYLLSDKYSVNNFKRFEIQQIKNKFLKLIRFLISFAFS